MTKIDLKKIILLVDNTYASCKIKITLTKCFTATLHERFLTLLKRKKGKIIAKKSFNKKLYKTKNVPKIAYNFVFWARCECPKRRFFAVTSEAKFGNLES